MAAVPPLDPRLRVPVPRDPLVTQARRPEAPQEIVERRVSHSATADGGVETVEAAIGFTGTLLSAQINNDGQNDLEPGDAWAQAEVWRGAFTVPGELTAENRLYTLARGALTNARGPAGFGSLPVMAGDTLVLRTWQLVGGRIGLRITGFPGVTLPPNWTADLQNPEGDLVGRTFDFTTADPAAGSDIADQTVALNSRWLFKTITAQLVTDGTVADREFFIELISLSEGTLYTSRLHDPQQASETRDYVFALAGTPYHATEDANGFLHQELPLKYLDSADILRFTTDGLVAGDNWSAAVIGVKDRMLVQ